MGQSMENLDNKLEDIFVRLDNLAAVCTGSDVTPYGESSGLQSPVFSRLFVGSSKKPLTFNPGSAMQHPVFKAQKWYAPSTSKC